MEKKRLIIIISACLACRLAADAGIVIDGGAHPVITEKPASSTGLNDVFVVYDTQGLSAAYTPTSGGAVSVMRYSNLGGGFAEPVNVYRDGNTYTFPLETSDMGYIVSEGTDRYYCWVVNYANHHCKLQKLTPAQEQECDRARLELDGEAGRIIYYTINGGAVDLSRGLRVSYTTLTYDEAAGAYTSVAASQTLDWADHAIGVKAPLCDTDFTVTGDRFLEAWGEAESVTSPLFKAIAVEAHTSAEQAQRDNDNEQKVDDGLGGSAPADITFTATVTDAAIFREWQMSTDPEFETMLDRFQQLELTNRFDEQGTYYLRFVANNEAGTCEYIGETYEVSIGESALRCPNAFSPNGDGVNDEWKVSYKSIVSYECHIYNRWGQEMKSMTDPSEGWDGRYGGKYVPTGAYYYVIKAVGSDGRKYNLSGDINIVKAKINSATSSEE